MSGETKTRIPEAALELFAQNGYAGTSMSDIAARLGITKPALYRHVSGKHAILERIVERMRETDYERAAEYEMPGTEPDGFADAYLRTPVDRIRAYSIAQFRHWTEEPFSAQFRKMLTVEQYHDAEMARQHGGHENGIGLAHFLCKDDTLRFGVPIRRVASGTSGATGAVSARAGGAPVFRRLRHGSVLPSWRSATARQKSVPSARRKILAARGMAAAGAVPSGRRVPVLSGGQQSGAIHAGRK